MSDEPQQGASDDRGDAPRRTGRAQSPPGSDRAMQGWVLPGQDPAGRPRRTGWRRIVPGWRMLLGGLLLLGVLFTGALVIGYTVVDIPAANATAVAQSNVYLYSDGTQLAREGKINRENVPLSEIPRHAQLAVLAAEDRNFYNEAPVDPKAMARAGWNMLRGGDKQSGSTITQQYVKNYYLDQEQTLTRKVKELVIAVKIDREMSKDDILRGYLNTSYFGRNAYGIQAAAQAYYSKSAAELTKAEGAYLAGLLNAPGAYDPRADPGNRERAVERWNYVLDGMVEQGWLSKSERRRMTFPEPGPIRSPTELSGQRGYLVEAVKDHLAERGILSRRRLADGGYRITTSIDRRKQQALVAAVDRQVTEKLSEEREKDTFVRVGGTSIDVSTGRVVAMYGGVDFTRQYVNNATRRDYQVGSTFKPFVLASAIEHDSRTRGGKRITPRTAYDGTNKREVIGPDGGPIGFAPANEDNHSYGQIPVSQAMDKSVNAVFAQMGVDVGVERVKDTAVELGLPADTPGLKDPGATISLGTATAATLDMAEAYATLADHGRRTPHTLVVEITRDGEEVELPDRERERAVSRRAADTTTAVLMGVVKGGTGTAAQSAGRPAAGKTGTAEEDKAAWFAGYTPGLATVITLMGQNPETGRQEPLYGALGQARINGGGEPARIWGAYTAAALKGSSARKFDLDAGKVGDIQRDPSIGPSAERSADPSAAPSAGRSAGPSATPPDEEREPEPGRTRSPAPPTEPGTGAPPPPTARPSAPPPGTEGGAGGTGEP